MNKRALILAAGRGSRMGESTKNSHKCLTVLKKKTLLEWQNIALKKGGIDEVFVVKGYKQEMLKGDFGTFYNKDWATTNMVASLFCADAFQGDTIVSYSDIVYQSDHVKKLSEAKGDIVVLADLNWLDLWSIRFEDPLDDAENFRFEKNTLLEIGGKSNNVNDIQAQYMGLVKLSKKGWQVLFNKYNSYEKEKQNKIDFTSLLSDILKDGITINVEFIEGGWCEVDNMLDLKAYEKKILEDENWLKI